MLRKHWHHTSIQLVSPSGNPCPDENRLSINVGAHKNLKGMAFMLKKKSSIKNELEHLHCQGGL